MVEETDRTDGRDSGDAFASLVIAAAMPLVPLLIFLVQNGARIGDTTALWIVGGVASVACVALALVVHLRYSWRTSGLVAGAGGYALFSNSWMGADKGVLATRLFLFVVSAAVIALVAHTLIGRSRRGHRLSAALIAVVVVGLVFAGGRSPNAAPEAVAYASIDPVSTPNVYVIVMDGLSRVDLLRRDFPDIDIDESLERLEAIGFATSDSSTSNYTRTHLSIPSLLNGTYQAMPTRPLDAEGEWVYARNTFDGQNTLVQTMTAAGYEYWHAESKVWGHGRCPVAVADRCLGGGSDPELVEALWKMTPLGKTPFRPAPQDPISVVDQVLDSAPSERPRFVFAHLLSPHNPYKFGADCEPIWVGSLVEGWQPEYASFYEDETECLLDLNATAMERLIEHDPEAIVLLLSDHGHSFGVDFADGGWADRDVEIRFAAFRSVRVPESCETDDVRGHSLINVNELIVACLEQREPEWNELRFFTSGFSADAVSTAEVEGEQRLLLVDE